MNSDHAVPNRGHVRPGPQVLGPHDRGIKPANAGCGPSVSTEDKKTRMDTPPIEQLEIHIQARHELDEALNRAEESLKPAATMKQVGIQVTRHDAGRFTAAVSDKAPYGTTLQNWSAKPAFHRERPDGCV